VLKQGQYDPIPASKQIMIIWAAGKGYLDDLHNEKVAGFEKGLIQFIEKKYPQITEKLTRDKNLTDEVSNLLKTACDEFKTEFMKE
jgi:F-type H+-transporting ATPase subunit alpha